ncbi:MAG: hypothetical protein JW759_08745 [Candidatus Coatesbacteria bacterium]|nr:hypothetical protein [Candidatus Coatesbacteria bacterium]
MVRSFGCVLACVLALSCSAQALCAAEYDVNKGGSGDFTTIQAAMDAAVDGDVIIAYPGTYYENIHFGGKNITLRSLDPEDEEVVASTIIDGGQNGSVVMFSGTEGETSLLSGFTIINGISTYDGGGVRGGANPGPGTHAGINNCTISGNLAEWGCGGGLYRCDGPISNCTISGNSAEYGGGLDHCDGPISNCTISGNEVRYFGGGLHWCSGPICECAISDNSARKGGGLCYCNGTISNCTISCSTSAGDGGGLCGCDGAISSSTISGNSSGGDGGGLAYCGGTISTCTICRNSAGDCGGGLAYCDGPISSCRISGNSATGPWGGGGGLYYCDGSICNCEISGNSATREYGGGGGLCGCNGKITNCTIIGNWASSGGGLAGCEGTISNCAVNGNSADWYGGGLIGYYGRISNCLISSNSATGQHAIGGGLAYCDATISNCRISGNKAYANGGGLCVCYGQIGNSTISGNSAGRRGGGLASCGGTISSCIVWGNDAPEQPELEGCDYAVILHSCIRGWSGEGEGNISDDPLFVSGRLGDYYLSCRAAGQAGDSPCIDAGSGTAESLGLGKVTTRTDGVPDAGTVDMGYHYPLAPQLSPYIESWVNYPGEFAPGDALVGFVEAHNPGADVGVDVYVAFVLPNGAITSLTNSGLTLGTYPWVSNVVLPSGFHFGPTEVLRITVPESPGDYLFAAVLTEPGRFEFICGPSLFPFTVTGSYGLSGER